MAGIFNIKAGNHWRRIVRLVFLAHRYLGIVVGILMVVWCLSGIVLMYVSYPSLPEGRRVAALEPLELEQCCVMEGGRNSIGGNTRIASARIEMLAGVPIADVKAWGGARELIDLRSGQRISGLSWQQAATVAAEYARLWRLPPTASQVRKLAWDQWVTSEEYDENRPYYKFSYDDPARSDLYVSALSGEAMQFTTEELRFWNWLGAVPHWVYFEPLRRHEVYWVQFIIVTSAIGSFLTLTGIYIGVRQYLRRPARRTSPYRGYMFWHHIPGLVFGVFLLTWVVSGLFSVTPYGLLDGGDIRSDQQRLMGSAPTWGQLVASLRELAQRPGNDDLVSLRAAPLDGELFFIGTRASGDQVRIGSTGERANLTAADRALEARLLGGGPHTVPKLMRHFDAYYYYFDGFPPTPVELPVYRLVLNNADYTRYYLDPVTGSILTKADAGARGYRWLHFGPHRMDFTPLLRSRPLWDVVTLILLLGSTLIAGTGLYSAVLRVTGRRRGVARRQRGTGGAQRPQQRLSG